MACSSANGLYVYVGTGKGVSVFAVCRSGDGASRILSVVNRVTVGPRFIELARVIQQTFL